MLNDKGLWQAHHKRMVCLNERLLENIRQDDYAGYDPFDLLNSKLLQATPFYRSGLVRLAWLQLGKRSPLNLRPLLRVPKKRNPKGVGLFISGLLQDYYRTFKKRYLTEACRLADWLLNHRCDLSKWHHSCWGYHFDWQARAFYVPAGKPNIITTVYIARALFELGEITDNSEYCNCALDAANFISQCLFTEEGGRFFYAYIPGEKAFVHNANLWGAAWCAFVGQRLSDSAMVKQALCATRQSVNEQQSDGSWIYGTLHHHNFIDGFHTGYNLEALCLVRESLTSEDFDDSINKGYSYYIKNFFTEEGTAKYYNNNIYPMDMHSFSQAIFTLLKVGRTLEDLDFCHKVVKRAIDLMYMPSKGQFVYQKTSLLKNSINYARWTQAWAYHALAFYNRYCAEVYDAKD